MQPLRVIHVLDESTNIGRCLLKGLVLFEIDLLLFLRFEKTFSFGIVIGIAFG